MELSREEKVFLAEPLGAEAVAVNWVFDIVDCEWERWSVVRYVSEGVGEEHS